MLGFMDNFRQGRNEVRAARGMPPLPGGQRDAGQDRGEPSWDEAPAPDDAAQNPAVAELQAALQERDGELAENKRLLAEMADYAEKMEGRVVEVIAGAEPMAKALRLPGVKTFLLQKFHPDKYPEADERQRAMLTEAMKTITAAYAVAAELQTSE